jgi:hypothetical protein
MITVVSRQNGTCLQVLEMTDQLAYTSEQAFWKTDSCSASQEMPILLKLEGSFPQHGPDAANVTPTNFLT